MSVNPVIQTASYCLAHVPDLVRYGSKPWREIAKDESFETRLIQQLRSFEAAVSYPPNQVFIGNLSPAALATLPRPWYSITRTAQSTPSATGRFGEIVSADVFYAILKHADVLEPGLIGLSDQACAQLSARLGEHRVLAALASEVPKGKDVSQLRADIAAGRALPLRLNGELVGCVRRDDRAEGRDDENLDARTLLEGLSAKATAAMALMWLLERARIGPEAIDFVISCGEEAVGDRYQRGGGGIAKAVGEMCGCVNASGMDIKNFCAAPASALITAGALVKIGLYKRVAVVAGGSLAKLGMKSEAFIEQDIPLLGDCLAAHAFLVTRDDGKSPLLHLEPGSVGMATIGSSASDEAVYRQLLLDPLHALGLSMRDIDKYAPELHNPEIMEHSGSGDVVHKNYRMIAAMAVLAGAIEKAEMESFIADIGMVGFAPTQGHIPSGVAYLGHALDTLNSGQSRRVMVLAKASLFLNRLTELYDGVSFILEANPGRNEQPREV